VTYNQSVAKYDHFNPQTQPSVSQFWDASPDLLGAGNTSNSRYLSDFEEISLLGMVDHPGLFDLKFNLSRLLSMVLRKIFIGRVPRLLGRTVIV
jgi:hypothetical protein